MFCVWNLQPVLWLRLVCQQAAALPNPPWQTASQTPLELELLCSACSQSEPQNSLVGKGLWDHPAWLETQHHHVCQTMAPSAHPGFPWTPGGWRQDENTQVINIPLLWALWGTGMGCLRKLTGAPSLEVSGPNWIGLEAMWSNLSCPCSWHRAWS